MPINTHLQWFDIADFTSGIWDASAVKGRFAAPANAFRTMTGYQPIKGGGVRAAVATSTSISMAGVGANECITGIWARNGVNRAAGVGGTGGDSTDMVIVTKSTADFKIRVYRRDGTVAAPAWSVRTTSAATSGAGHQITDFAFFKDSAGVEWLAISHFGVAVYLMRFDFTVASNTGNDGLISTMTSTFTGPICVSQNRILVGGGNDDSINWTNVGVTTGIGGTNFLKVASNRAEANVSIISNIEPADLLVGKEGAPWVLISGDISNTATPVREMGDDHHQRQDKQQCPRVPGGIAFIEGDGRVFITNDGRTFQSISDNISPFRLFISPSLVGTGTMAYLNSLLFAPGPFTGTNPIGTNIYDFDTNCWHRISDIDYAFGWADPYGGNVWIANHTTVSPAIISINALSTGARQTSGILQTVEFADKNGRNVDIREVQLFTDNPSGGGDYTVELIDQSGASVVTRTASTVTNKQMVSFLFPNTKSEYLSVKITAASHNGSSDAPSIERIRIGFAYNNLIS
jgi:hypothetical protein